MTGKVGAFPLKRLPVAFRNDRKGMRLVSLSHHRDRGRFLGQAKRAKLGRFLHVGRNDKKGAPSSGQTLRQAQGPRRFLHALRLVGMTMGVEMTGEGSFDMLRNRSGTAEISPCASLRFPTCGRLPVAFRNDRWGSRDVERSTLVKTTEVSLRH